MTVKWFYLMPGSHYRGTNYDHHDWPIVANGTFDPLLLPVQVRVRCVTIPHEWIRYITDCYDTAIFMHQDLSRFIRVLLRWNTLKYDVPGFIYALVRLSRCMVTTQYVFVRDDTIVYDYQNKLRFVRTQYDWSCLFFQVKRKTTLFVLRLYHDWHVLAVRVFYSSSL